MWQGLTMKSLKHHYSLYPLMVATGVGAMAAMGYIFRLTQNADSSWARSKNPHPWTRIQPNQNIKFIDAKRVEKASLKKAGPDI
ncbi:cytochrome c oxidase subunit NDUFA4-like [Amphiura filiformis]|uniref:cytochrome c oxidase subunit NDUFA4-like n=1 Tax=Amphiura filiformis TaxID=82378 RepID=UPI003B21F029